MGILGSLLGVMGGLAGIYVSIIIMEGLLYYSFGASYAVPSGHIASNFLVSFCIIAFSIVNIRCNRLSCWAIIFLSCYGFIFVNESVAQYLWISFIGGVMTYRSLINQDHKNNIKYGVSDYEVDKKEPEFEHRKISIDKMGTIIGITGGILGIAASLIMVYITKLSYNLHFIDSFTDQYITIINVSVSCGIIFLSLFNIIYSKVAYVALIALLCFSFIYANDAVSICVLISLTGLTMTLIPSKTIVKKHQLH